MDQPPSPRWPSPADAIGTFLTIWTLRLVAVALVALPIFDLADDSLTLGEGFLALCLAILGTALFVITLPWGAAIGVGIILLVATGAIGILVLGLDRLMNPIDAIGERAFGRGNLGTIDSVAEARWDAIKFLALYVGALGLSVAWWWWDRRARGQEARQRKQLSQQRQAEARAAGTYKTRRRHKTPAANRPRRRTKKRR